MKYRIGSSLTLVGLSIALMSSSCGVFKKKSKSAPEASFGRGVLQGVVRNELTGERIAIESGNKNVGIYAIVKNRMIPATAHLSLAEAKSETADETLVGEYFIAGLPLDVAIPVVVKIEGYELFEGETYISSTRAQRTGASEVRDELIDHPIVLANINVVPTGTEAQDVEVLVQDDKTTPISGALVKVSHTDAVVGSADGKTEGADNRQFGNGYFTPKNPRARTFHGETDGTGTVKIPGTMLALGVGYTIEVTPPYEIQTPDGSVDSFKVAYRAKEFALELNNEKPTTNVVKVTVISREVEKD